MYMPQIVAVALGAATTIGFNALFTWEKVDDWFQKAVIGGFFNFWFWNWIKSEGEYAAEGIANELFIMGGLASFKLVGLVMDSFSYLTAISTHVTKASLWIFAGFFLNDGSMQSHFPKQLATLIPMVGYYETVNGGQIQAVLASSLASIALFFSGAVSHCLFKKIKKTYRTRVTRQFI